MSDFALRMSVTIRRNRVCLMMLILLSCSCIIGDGVSMIVTMVCRLVMALMVLIWTCTSGVVLVIGDCALLFAATPHTLGEVAPRLL